MWLLCVDGGDIADSTSDAVLVVRGERTRKVVDIVRAKKLNVAMLNVLNVS